MPKNGGIDDPALLGGDEMWTRRTNHILNRWGPPRALDISEGMMSAENPVLPRWAYLYQALRVCNIFLENINKVPDLPAWECEKWIAEVKVLKAYYHFCLVQMYGPIPIIRENLPIDIDVFSVRVERDPVDECFNYIVQLIDEACYGYTLPDEIADPESDLGRITKPIALSIKAIVLVNAASPLFNGNEQQATLRNRNGKQLFNITPDPDKWKKAMDACETAIVACHNAGFRLYEFPNPGNRHTNTIVTDLSLRNAFSERWNSDVVWANTQMISIPEVGGMIQATMPKLNPAFMGSGDLCQFLGMPIKIARMFYTKNGVPLEEDNTRDIKNIYNLRTAGVDDQLYVYQGRTTVDLHFDREPRFYAWVGFDGGVWFGADKIDDRNPTTLRYLAMKMGETDGTQGQGNWTGYIPKKYIPYLAQVNALNSISATSYAWPIVRLSNLYLLYAETINEVEGPNGTNSATLFEYIDMVRARAGLEGVKKSWDTYTNAPKYNNQNGMRKIIQQERMIELAFEGYRFWDIRRWKIAHEIYSTPLEGWYMKASIADGTEEEINRIMYQPQFLLRREFGNKDYFWPIRTADIDVNPNLVQNIGW